MDGGIASALKSEDGHTITGARIPPWPYSSLETPEQEFIMAGATTLSLLCLVGVAIGVPTSKISDGPIACPSDQNETSVAVPIANRADCGTFYECDNGMAKLFACPAGTFFSSEHQVCTYKKDSDCPDPAATRSSSRRANLDFTCPDDEGSDTATYFPNPKNCSTFYECSNETPVLMECPRKMFFNARLCVCTLPKRSGCTQPDDDDDNDFVGPYGSWSNDDWSHMKKHLETVYSGKCYKDNNNNGDDDS